MQRLTNANVLQNTVLSAVSQLHPGEFAYAEKYNDIENKYIGLVVKSGVNTQIVISNDSVIVRSQVAVQQPIGPNPPPGVKGDEPIKPPIQPELLPKSFRSSVDISIDTPAKDISKISENILDQLTSIPGAKIEMTLEITADTTEGIDITKQRILLENANALGFKDTNLS